MKLCLLALLLATSRPAPPAQSASEFLTAIDAGDPQAVAAMIDHRPDQSAQALATARNLIAARRLAAALHNRFGRTADPIGLHPLPSTQELATANLAADDTHATLQTPGDSISLVRVGDEWKIRLLDQTTATVQELWLTNHLAAAMNEVSADVQAGKYASIDDAKHALQLSMGAIVTKLMVNDSATTKPSTMP